MRKKGQDWADSVTAKRVEIWTGVPWHILKRYVLNNQTKFITFIAIEFFKYLVALFTIT